METLQNIFQAEIIQKLGWTLVHFVWQAIAIGLILAIILKLLHKSSANLRYVIACIALALIVVMPAVTIKMIDVSSNIIVPINRAAIELPKTNTDTQLFLEIPPIEPTKKIAASSRISLKGKFIETIEPALPYLVIGWFIGVFGLSLWHLGGWRQLQKLRKKMIKNAPYEITATAKKLSHMLGIKKTISIAESALVEVPTVIGHLKPIILLPASALTGLSVQQIEAILAHELAHISRHDYLVNILQTVVEILGFYHPAVWWVSHKIRAERENCCDDIAVSLCSDRICYAKALTTMEEIRADKLSLAVAASGGNLFDRIRRLLGKDSASEVKISWLPSMIAMLLIVALLIPTALALSGNNKEQVGEKNDSSADAIIQKVLAKYSNMESYSAVGEVISDIDMSVTMEGLSELKPEIKESKEFQDMLKDSQRLKHTFSIKLAKPNLYCIEWEQKVHESFSNTGAVWSVNGEEHFLFNAGQKTSPKNRKSALAAATGVSGGVANTIPPFFFDEQSAILRVLPVNILNEEQIDGDRCYVISGRLTGITMNFWISKESFLIRQTKQIFDGELKFPEMELSDTELKEGLEAMGEEVTEQKIEELKKTMEKAKKQIPNLKGTITEIHRDIKINQQIEVVEFVPDINVGNSSSQIELPHALKNAQERAEELRQRSDSLKKLRGLGLMLIMYANDNDGKYPNNLEEIKLYDKDEVLPWVLENVRYLGQGKTAAIDPQAIMAYDKKMLLEKSGTNVLYNDSHVQFCDKEKIKDIKFEGIDIVSIEGRIDSARKLSNLGKTILIFANENDGRYPENLNELLKTGWVNEDELTWLTENIEYLGDKVEPTGRHDAVMAYDKTLLTQENSQGTNVLYNDSHVAFEKTEALKELGIKAKHSAETESDFVSQEQIEIQTRFLLISPAANEFTKFFEKENIKAALVNINNDTNVKNYILNDKQRQELLGLVRNNPDSKILAAPKVAVLNGENATITIKKDAQYTETAEDSGQPKEKDLTIGTILQVKPTLQNDSSDFLLDFEFEHINLLGFEDGLPQTEMFHIKSRISVPNGSTLLVGGQKITNDQNERKILLCLIGAVQSESGR